MSEVFYIHTYIILSTTLIVGMRLCVLSEVKQQASTSCLKIACEECGLVVDLPLVNEGQIASCPQCNYTLISKVLLPYQRHFSYGIACIVMLLLSLSFPFMSFSVQGLTQEINLFNIAKMLYLFNNFSLALLYLMTVIILPIGYILVVMFLYQQAYQISHDRRSLNISFLQAICRTIFKVEPWLMVDVFLIGVLVSLVKIASLADIGLGISFWTFCIYTVLIVKCVSMVDKVWLWEQFIPMSSLTDVSVGDSHTSLNHVSCHICCQLNPIQLESNVKCIRCNSKLDNYNPKINLQKSWALLITSITLYIPANLYPMMYTVSLGNVDGSTIIGGIILLWEMGSYPIAMVIFFASVVIPLAKMFLLGWLFISVRSTNDFSKEKSIKNLKLYRITEFVGRWSMIDIFVVAILVALVQLKSAMAIFPGPAALLFAAVVIFTMLSAMTFDSRMFWK